MIGRRALAVVSAAVAGVVAVGGGVAGGVAPAHGRMVTSSAVSKTPAQMDAAIAGMTEAMLAESVRGWHLECSTWSTVGGSTQIATGSAPTALAMHMTYVDPGSKSASAYWFASESQWITPILTNDPYGLTESNLNVILAQSQVPATTRLMSGPWKPWVSRYSSVDLAGGYSLFRKKLLQGAVKMSIAAIQHKSGAVVTYEPGRGKGGLWRASWGTDAQGQSSTVVIDPFGLLKSSTFTSKLQGQTDSSIACLTTGVGVTRSVPQPPGPVAPLKTIGPVAWKVSKNALAAEMAKAIKATVVASGDITASRVRGEAWIELDKRGLKNTWSLQDIPGGTRLWITDALGGTVQRCIKASQGAVTISLCS